MGDTGEERAVIRGEFAEPIDVKTADSIFTRTNRNRTAFSHRACPMSSLFVISRDRPGEDGIVVLSARLFKKGVYRVERAPVIELAHCSSLEHAFHGVEEVIRLLFGCHFQFHLCQRFQTLTE